MVNNNNHTNNKWQRRKRKKKNRTKLSQSISFGLNVFVVDFIVHVPWIFIGRIRRIQEIDTQKREQFNASVHCVTALCIRSMWQKRNVIYVVVKKKTYTHTFILLLFFAMAKSTVAFKCIELHLPYNCLIA